MCQHIAETAAEAMAAVQPLLTTFLSFENLPTAEIQTVETEYTDAEQALYTWTPGTPGAEVVELLTDFNTGFQALPVPAPDKLLESVIVAAVTAVIGAVTAHEPAATPTTAAAVANAQEVHAMAVQARTSLTVSQLVPEWKPSRFHSVTSQIRKVWDGRVAQLEAIDPKYSVLRTAVILKQVA